MHGQHYQYYDLDDKTVIQRYIYVWFFVGVFVPREFTGVLPILPTYGH